MTVEEVLCTEPTIAFLEHEGFGKLDDIKAAFLEVTFFDDH